MLVRNITGPPVDHDYKGFPVVLVKVFEIFQRNGWVEAMGCDVLVLMIS